MMFEYHCQELGHVRRFPSRPARAPVCCALPMRSLGLVAARLRATPEPSGEEE